jgi:hypothetical protein
LKKRHLNKHRKDANKFVERVAVHNFTSDVARGYAKRINKYRNMLFTFLAHDGVPWNNNNAEHAIKSFAKYRRFADGVVTENTIKDYLVMLSVCLSWVEAWGKDFPHFARNYVDRRIVIWSLPLTTNSRWGEKKDHVRVKRLRNAKFWV